jgi:hypothetical protein
MKALPILLCILFIVEIHSLYGQSIAGQSNGDNIVFYDITDIQMTCNSINSSSSQFLDINNDNIDDLQFQAFYFYYSHLQLMGTQTDVIPGLHVQFSCIDTNDYCLRYHHPGDTINEKLTWLSPQYALFNTYDNNEATECFSSNGYIGFRICENDTIYGWIHAGAYGNYMEAGINIYDYAYVTGPDAIYAQTDQHRIQITNPVTTDLKIVLPLENSPELSFCTIYDLTGRKLEIIKLVGGENHLNITSLENGVYIVVINRGTKNVASMKIIKV